VGGANKRGLNRPVRFERLELKQRSLRGKGPSCHSEREGSQDEDTASTNSEKEGGPVLKNIVRVQREPGKRIGEGRAVEELEKNIRRIKEGAGHAHE